MTKHRPLSGAAIAGLIVAAFLLGCLLATVCLCAAEGAAVWLLIQPQLAGSGGDADLLHVGDSAPDFSLPDLDGHVVSLSDYRGRAVLLNFWATWCHYCIEEFPLIQAYQESYGGQLVVLAVEQGSSARTVNEFVANQGYPFVFLLDEHYSAGAVYGAMALPTTYFLDPEGVIQKVLVGMMEEADIESGLRSIGLK